MHINLFTQVWHGWSRDASACRRESSDLRRIEVAIKCAEEGWEQRRQTMAAQLVQRFATNTYKLITHAWLTMGSAWLRPSYTYIKISRQSLFSEALPTTLPPRHVSLPMIYTPSTWVHPHVLTPYTTQHPHAPRSPAGTDMTQASPP